MLVAVAQGALEDPGFRKGIAAQAGDLLFDRVNLPLDVGLRRGQRDLFQALDLVLDPITDQLLIVDDHVEQRVQEERRSLVRLRVQPPLLGRLDRGGGARMKREHVTVA